MLLKRQRSNVKTGDPSSSNILQNGIVEMRANNWEVPEFKLIELVSINQLVIKPCITAAKSIIKMKSWSVTGGWYYC